MINRTLIFLFVLLFQFENASAIEPQLDKAKVLIASNKTRDAIPLLEELIKLDASPAPHNYFLGMCLIKEGIRIEEAVKYLEKAELNTPRPTSTLEWVSQSFAGITW